MLRWLFQRMAEAFERQARLSSVAFSGALPQKKYTRFMLIGRA